MSREQPTKVWDVVTVEGDKTILQRGDGRQATVKTEWLAVTGGTAKATSWRTEMHVENADWK